MFVYDVAETVRNVSSAGLALLVTKGINQFPEPDQKLKGTIDVWWIVHILFSVLFVPFFHLGVGGVGSCMLFDWLNTGFGSEGFLFTAGNCY